VAEFLFNLKKNVYQQQCHCLWYKWRICCFACTTHSRKLILFSTNFVR